MKFVGKLIAGILGGIVAGIIGLYVVTLPSSGSGEVSQPLIMAAFFGFLLLTLILAISAGRPAKAWRRALILCAVLSFALPLSMFVSSTLHVTEVPASGVDHPEAFAAGAAIGGALATGVMGFISFFLGGIFLIVGLLVGRDPKVVHIHHPAESQLEPSAS